MLPQNCSNYRQQNQPFWHSRGYLPHYNEQEKSQMITYRLNDSLPESVLADLTTQLEHVSPNVRQIERYRRIEQYLDQGAGSCALSNPSIAQLVEDNLRYFDNKNYKLHAWVVMPNHVHVLITPNDDITLYRIIQSWKSYTAKKANASLGTSGEFWQREYFDRMIRNEKHYMNAVAYIHTNPVKARLCKHPSEWSFGSARYFL